MAHCATSFTLVAEQVTAHFVDSRVTACTCRTGEERACLLQAAAGREEMNLRPSDPFSFDSLWLHGIISCFHGVIFCVTLLESMLRRAYRWETQQVSMNGNFEFDYVSPGKTGDQQIDAMSKVCDGLRGDAFVAAQEVGYDHLCEIVDGRPRAVDTLIQHVRGMAFPLTEHESKALFRQYRRPEGPLSNDQKEYGLCTHP